MSKVLLATCDAQGAITADGLKVQGLVLSEGKKASEGLFVLDKGQAYYIPSNATDIKDLIQAVVGIINQVAVICTGLDGASTSPGAQAGNIATLQTLKSQLDTMKGALK